MTTIGQIKNWIENASKEHTHMIVVCDTFDYSDFPVYVKNADEAREMNKYYNSQDMHRVMEIYSLKMPIEPQLKEHRARNF